MLNIAYTHASVVFFIFHYYTCMLQHKQSLHIIQCGVGGCVIIQKVEYLDIEGS